MPPPTDVPAAFPDTFVRNTIGIHGAAGEEWLQTLPRRISDCATRWNLTISRPYDLSYNYVAPATMTSAEGDVSEVVLKLGFPGSDFIREHVALHYFKGKGCVRTIRADPAAGAMVIERASPGITLDRATSDDTAATRVAASLMRQLSQPIPPLNIFPSLADWIKAFAHLRERFSGSTGPLPGPLVAEAEALAIDLISSSPEPVLLHGDLHPGNILTSERAGYLAIDPKGVIGDPAFEPGAFLLNPHPVPADAMSRRLIIFAEYLGLDRERIRAWGLVRAVLSACWTLEDNGNGYDSAIHVADQLMSLQ